MISLGEKQVLELAFIYERVKYKHTGQASVVVGRKNPVKSINYETLKTFGEKALLEDIVPVFYFDSLYEDGKRVIPSKPECARLLDKVTNAYYLKHIHKFNADRESIVESLEVTRKNIDTYLAGASHTEKVNDRLLSLDPLERTVYPDFAVLVKNGLVSGYLFYLHQSLMRFSRFLPDKTDRNLIESRYARNNRNGTLDKLLSALFSDIIRTTT